jgi:hypothetical protein
MKRWIIDEASTWIESQEWLDKAYTWTERGQENFLKNCESRDLNQDICSDIMLSFMHQPVEPKVQTDEKKVGNPNTL